ncbi:MAG: M56 family metallopeptidase [Aminipila sp.]
MNEFVKVLLSLSISGTLLIFILMLCKPLIRHKISKRWQYYIWLIVIARLLLPFTLEINFLENMFQQIDKVIPQSEMMVEGPEQKVSGLSPYMESDDQNSSQRSMETSHEPKAVVSVVQNIFFKGIQNAWLAWLFIAAMLLIRKITLYQSFVKYIKAGRVEVSDLKYWEHLGELVEQAGIKRAVSIYINPLISSPLLIGFFRPCIMLSTLELSDSEFKYTIMHELTHYKRHDMFYKWLVQITICIHWFNPVMYLMGREINKACELSCDETVIKGLTKKEKYAYGDTLIEAMKTGGHYENSLASVTLTESVKLLKERLDAIMRFKKSTRRSIYISLLLTLVLSCGFTFSGSYAAVSINTGTASTPDIKAGGTINNKTIYFIYTEKGLRSIGTRDNSLDKLYMLANDIVLSSDEWIPIGTATKPFTGIFDGNGFTIRGLTMTNPDTKLAGLFGYAQGASLHNIELRDIDISSAGEKIASRKVDPICAVPTNVSLGDNRVYPKINIRPNEKSTMSTFVLAGKTYYQVENETQLRLIGQKEYSLDKNYIQAADIQMSTAEWKPIGTAEKPFTGTFCGNGYEIKGLTMSDPNAKVIGLFGFADGAILYNITMRDYDIATAGRNVKNKSISPILVFGTDSHSYDNNIYPKQ